MRVLLVLDGRIAVVDGSDVFETIIEHFGGEAGGAAAHNKDLDVGFDGVEVVLVLAIRV